MPNTYSQIYIQIVFAVKERECFIKQSFREELEKYITGIVTNKGQKLYAIYCMPDHVHLLVSIKPGLAIADLVRDIKANSSSFIKAKKWVNSIFSWQEGYGVFSYHKSQAKNVLDFILGQPEYHRRISFKEEYLNFLKEHEVEYEQKYLFEFYE
jgi:putative transposase